MMAIRALVVGLEAVDRDALHDALARMRAQVEDFESPALAKAALPGGGFHLAIVGYESEGCGLPLAVNLRAMENRNLHLDCIVVARQSCPALEKAANELGVLAVLERPIRAKALALAVEAHLAKRMRTAGSPVAPQKIA